MGWKKLDMILKRQGKEDLDHNGGNIYGNTNLHNGNFNVNGGDYYMNGHVAIPVGGLMPYIDSVAPNGWLLCDGSEIEINTYRRLYNIIGSRFGVASNSTTHFVLPDLRGRVPVGSGTDGSLTERTIGEKGGAETHTLTADEMPSHIHSGTTEVSGEHVHSVDTGTIDDSDFLAQNGQPPAVDSNDMKNYYNTNTAGEHSHKFTTNAIGGNMPHNNMQPFIVLNYIIRY
jgi:microcystin-dependent protein